MESEPDSYSVVSSAPRPATGFGRARVVPAFPGRADEPAAWRVAATDELFSATEWKYVARIFRLTPCQARIAHMVCAGYSQAAMAKKAHVSINTVRMHVRGLFARLNAHDRVGVLVRLLSAVRMVGSGLLTSVACGT